MGILLGLDIGRGIISVYIRMFKPVENFYQFTCAKLRKCQEVRSQNALENDSSFYTFGTK